MATLTIRQLDDATHAALRVRAAENGRSVEAEVRAILDENLAPRRESPIIEFHRAVRDILLTTDGPELEFPDRKQTLHREPVTFD